MGVAQQRSRPFYLFGLCAVAILFVCYGIIRSGIFQQKPAIGAAGITFDLTITMAGLYYLLVVRPGRAPALSVIPVLLVGVRVAYLLLPASQHNILQPLVFVVAPLEIFSMGWLIYRVRRTVTHKSSSAATSTDDPLQRFEAGLRSLYGNARFIDFVMAELSVFYFAIIGHHFPQPVPEGTVVITSYKKRGWEGMMALIAFLIVLEGTVVHIALQQWSSTAAWVWTAFDGYAILLVAADYQALRLRPSLLTGDHLHIRFGLRWQAVVPLAAIRLITPFAWKTAPKPSPHYLKLALLSDPDLVITLREPIEFRGPMGLCRQIRRIGLQSDDPELATRIQTSLANRLTHPA